MNFQWVQDICSIEWNANWKVMSLYASVAGTFGIVNVKKINNYVSLFVTAVGVLLLVQFSAIIEVQEEVRTNCH